MPSEDENPKKTKKSSEGMWKILSAVLIIIIILLLISRIRFTISASTIIILFLIGAIFIFFLYYQTKPKPAIDIFKSAQEIANKILSEQRLFSLSAGI